MFSLSAYKITIFATLIFLLFGASLFFFTPAQVVPDDGTSVPASTQTYFDTNPSFPELSDYLGNLADEKGAVYALNALIYGILPPSIDTHLMGHFVARKLYKEQGVDGLKHCTDDLGYACAHAIVIESLFERGVAVFDVVNDICSRAPGSNGAYFMCFHGLGHGVLAFTEYELPEAIKLCELVGTNKFNYYEAVECVGGAIMEMRGGIHDPEVWERNGKKYMNDVYPMEMCLADYMSERYRYICFTYITPFIFDSIGAQDLPTWEEYKEAINLCDVLENSSYREACYGGFAKEFVSFVYGRDIRMIETATDYDLSRMSSACSLANAEDGKKACIEHSIYALTRTGMYHYSLAGRYCSIVPSEFTEFCFGKFLNTLLTNNNDEVLQKDICAYVADTFKPMCEE